MKRDAPLFRIMVTHRDESAFRDAVAKRRKRYATDLNVAGEEVWFQRLIAAEDPSAYPYNDIYGFFDVFWDGGTRMLSDSYFRGDGRRRAGRFLKERMGVQRLKSQGFYMHWHRHQLSWIPRYGPPGAAADAVSKALTEVEDGARRLGGVADTGRAWVLFPHVNWTALLSSQSSGV